MGADAVRCRLHRAPDPSVIEREQLQGRNAYTQGKGELAWDTWPNRLVLRLSLQSTVETNDPLKSGPAKVGPAYIWKTSEVPSKSC